MEIKLDQYKVGRSFQKSPKISKRIKTIKFSGGTTTGLPAGSVILRFGIRLD